MSLRKSEISRLKSVHNVIQHERCQRGISRPRISVWKRKFARLYAVARTEWDCLVNVLFRLFSFFRRGRSLSVIVNVQDPRRRIAVRSTATLWLTANWRLALTAPVRRSSAPWVWLVSTLSFVLSAIYEHDERVKYMYIFMRPVDAGSRSVIFCAREICCLNSDKDKRWEWRCGQILCFSYTCLNYQWIIRQ